MNSGSKSSLSAQGADTLQFWPDSLLLEKEVGSHFIQWEDDRPWDVSVTPCCGSVSLVLLEAVSRFISSVWADVLTSEPRVSSSVKNNGTKDAFRQNWGNDGPGDGNDMLRTSLQPSTSSAHSKCASPAQTEELRQGFHFVCQWPQAYLHEPGQQLREDE